MQTCLPAKAGFLTQKDFWKSPRVAALNQTFSKAFLLQSLLKCLADFTQFFEDQSLDFEETQNGVGFGGIKFGFPD